MKRGHEYKNIMGKRIIDNRWMNITPFDKNSLERWRTDMRVDVIREPVATGYARVTGFKNYDKDIYPYDFKGIRGITDIVPEFGLLANYYKDILHRQFQFRYYGTLCQHLMIQGFQPKETLFGLPYDPRLILETSYRETYFNAIQACIEAAAKKQKITVVAHSLGGVLLKWFLTTHVDSPWIQRYLKKIVVVNAPFGGTTMAMRVIVSGEYYVPMFHQEFKESLQKMSGVLMCLPNAYAYDSKETLVKLDLPTPKNITVKDIAHIGQLKDKDMESLQTSFDIWRDLYQPHLKDIMTPIDLKGVSCSVMMGSHQWTIQNIHIKKEGELPFATHYEYGDGQVPTRSLMLANTIFQGDNVSCLDIPNANHIDILSHPLFLAETI